MAALVAAVLALIVILRSQAPPEAARLLPGADGFVYVNLKWIRRLSTRDLPTVQLDPEYQRFVTATGFQYERDLDEAAFAVHYSGPYVAPDGSPRFSEILTGRWDSERVGSYLQHLASRVENYHDREVFSIPIEGRTVRVALLSVGTIAISNVDDPGVVHQIIDRSRKLASPFGGPALLRQYYRKLPFGTLAWAILTSPSPVGRTRLAELLPLNSQQLLQGAVLLASVRFLRAVHLRLEAFYPDNGKADQLASQLRDFLDMFHQLQPTNETGGTDKDVKQFFDSLKVQHDSTRVVLSAVVPVGFVKKMFSEPPPEAAPAPTPSPTPAPAPQKRHKPRRQKSSSP
jgi:hypothetical protein